MPISARSREILIYGTLAGGAVAFIYYIGRRSYNNNQNPAFFYAAQAEPVFPAPFSAAAFLQSLSGDFPATTPVAPWAPPNLPVSAPSGTVPANWPSGGNWNLTPDAISNAMALGGGAFQTPGSGTGAGDQGGPGNAAAGSGQQGNAGTSNRGFGLFGKGLGIATGAPFGPVTGLMGIIGTLAQEGFLGPNLQGNQNANINTNPAAYADFSGEQPGFLGNQAALNAAAYAANYGALADPNYGSAPASDPGSDPGDLGNSLGGYGGGTGGQGTGGTGPGGQGEGGAENGPGGQGAND